LRVVVERPHFIKNTVFFPCFLGVSELDPAAVVAVVIAGQVDP
jgi:hypothetical protein